MAQPSSDLLFNVRRQKPELICPAKPTPHEVKLLSDIDDQELLRLQIPGIFFYRPNPSLAGKDPVKIIREALAQTLVFYYSFAGRLREGEGHKLIVDCNEEGIMFIEAYADVTLQQFGDDLQPPFQCFQDLIYSPGSDHEIFHCPIVIIQVSCGGFILGIHSNNVMSDGFGFVQFVKAIAEIANGATKPSILPLWHRELLNARNPPHVTCTPHKYDELLNIPFTNITYRSFFFGLTEVSSLRRLLPDHLRQSTTSFEVVTACIWHCRTKALKLDPHKDVRMMMVINTRLGNYRLNPPLPKGYYGNAIVLPTAISVAGKLCESPLGYAGPAKRTVEDFHGSIFYLEHKNSKREEGRLVPICLLLNVWKDLPKSWISYLMVFS